MVKSVLKNIVYYLFMCLIVSILSFAPLPVMAVNAHADEVITIKESVDAAIRHYPLSGYARANTGISEAEYKKQRASLMPSFNLSAGFGRAQGYDYGLTNGGIAALQAAVRINIFNPSGWFTSKQLAMSLKSAEFGQKAIENKIAYAVKNLFVNAVFYKRQKTIIRENINSLKTYLLFTKRLLSSGIATENDVLRTKIELGNARASLKTAGIKLINRLNALSSFTGMRFTPGVLLKEESVTFTVPASMNTFDEKTFADNPVLRVVEYELKSEHYNVKSARAQRLPVLSLEGDVGWLGASAPVRYNQYGGYSYLATLKFPLFRWGEITYSIEDAHLKLEKTKYKKALLLNELSLSYKNTLKELTNAIELIALYKKDTRLSKQNFDYSESRYAGGGRISSYDVLLDRQLMTNTRLQLIDAEKDFYRALYKIQFLRGRIYEYQK